jgi:hypothetical protein
VDEMNNVRLAARRSRVSTTLAIALCWVPPVIAIVFTVTWSELLALDLPTRWSGDEVTSTMPGWVVALGAIVISAVCSALATSAITSPDATPAAIMFSAGLSAVAASVWILIGSEAMFHGAAGITPLAAISPLLVLWGLLPLALSRARAQNRPQEV